MGGEALGGAHPAVPLGAEDAHVEAVPAQRDADHLRPQLVDGVAHHHDPGGGLGGAGRARPVDRLEDVLEGAHQDVGRGTAGDLAVRAGADLLQRRGDETAPRVDEAVLGHRRLEGFLEGGPLPRLGHDPQLRWAHGRTAVRARTVSVDGGSRLPGRHPVAHQADHRAQPLDVVGQVPPVRPRGALLGADAVPALPGPQGRGGHPEALGHLGDGEGGFGHGLRAEHCTRHGPSSAVGHCSCSDSHARRGGAPLETGTGAQRPKLFT